MPEQPPQWDESALALATGGISGRDDVFAGDFPRVVVNTRG
jgi:hypothetical protein